MTTMLDAALAYIAEGRKVFPCKTNKTPYTSKGLKDATLLQIQAKEYWAKWPNASIGMPTDDLIVLDFDLGHGGLESKAAIEKKYGSLPQTRVHQTGGGGQHWIYANPNGTNARNTVCFAGYKGVDLRANGGYVILPPSPHPSGNRYEVLDDSPIAPAPGWLMYLLTNRGKPISPNDAAMGTPIPEGRRNATLATIAGAMRRHGASETVIEAALMEANQTQCNPPLPAADVRRIAGSIARYAPEPGEFDYLDPPDMETDITDNLDITDGIDKEAHLLTPLTFTDNLLTNVSENAECSYSQNEDPSVDISSEKMSVPPITPLLNKTCTLIENEVTIRLDRRVWPEVDKWLLYHKGEAFDLDTICRQLDVKTRDARHSVVKKLSHEVRRGKLEKSARLYTMVNKEYVLVNWAEADVSKTIGLHWPYGIDDNTSFGFDGHAIVSPGDIIVLAGASNAGKSAFCLNLLWENFDLFPCTLMGNEYTPVRFKRRAERMNWRNPLKENGEPKFELIERHERWKDIIRPDNINIIDWINLGDNFYQIGSIIEGIQQKLKGGIAVISIQKSEGKALGLGGGFSEHLASLYLTVDFGRITVRKCKEWFDHDPNREMYGFDIVRGGSRFQNIRPVKICFRCNGQGRTFKGKCEACLGLGHLDR